MTETPKVVQRFIEALETVQWDDMTDAYADDAVFDASVPKWRFQLQGPEAVVAQLKDWFPIVPNLVEATATATADGAVVELEMRRQCPGDESHASHLEGTRQAHIFQLAGDRIVEHRVYCAGEWNEEDFRRIDEEAPKVARPAPR